MKARKYALLIGGGVSDQDNFKSFYCNIEYAIRTLLKLGFDSNDIKILFYRGKSSEFPIGDGEATRESVLNELRKYSKIVNSNDSLFIFRSGHGLIELIFEKHGILSREERIPENENIKTIGTAAVMCFPDGNLSYLEFQESLKSIRARQIVVLLNQCYSGQFTDITTNLSNTVVISQTGEIGFGFMSSRTPKRWTHNVWPFVKCMFDGFLSKDDKTEKISVLDAFEYMLLCNPNVEGVSLQADRPILKETPQIKYGNRLKRGTIFIH